MRYKVTYERKTGKNSYYSYTTEIIEARGIVHAHKLAQAHLKELQKMSSYKIRIDYIRQMEAQI